jgi:hypothetical protein
MKDVRVEIRMTKQQRNLLKRICVLQNTTMSSFLLRALYAESDRLHFVHPVALKSMGLTDDDLLEL